MQRVFVTGMGVVSPLGCNTDEFWQGLLAGRSGVKHLNGTQFNASDGYIGAIVSGFPENYFGPRQARRLSRSSQFALVAAAQAIAQASLPIEGDDASDIGVILGSSVGGFAASEGFFKDFFLRGRKNPMIIPVAMNAGPASNISIRYGLHGPLLAVDAACASAAHAIGYAYHMIRSGMLNIVITGGTDCPFSPGVMAAWSSLGVLAENNGPPDEACRPFSADRNGIVLGEGAGILVLESADSVSRRGSRPLAEIRGYGASSDSHHLTQPSLEGPALAMCRALSNAAFSPHDIHYINAHGTGTPWNDRNETAAIKQVFGDHARRIPVVANKAALGHSVAASGALELISTILSLQHQVLSPTLNCRIPDPACDLDYVTNGSRQHQMQSAMSNSFAFGGSNAALIVSAA